MLRRIVMLAIALLAIGYVLPKPKRKRPEAHDDLTTGAREVQNAVARYDRHMLDDAKQRYYGGSGFYNLGYWTPGVETQRQASEALVNRLLDRIPAKQGAILDVACGMGASTKMLLEHYPPQNVTAINYSDVQLRAASERAPGASFARMDAACLAFADAQFDAVICVESAFHFNSREDFFREAFRVLKPGGHLVMADILGRVPYPVRENYLSDPAAFARHLSMAGFKDVWVEDTTRESWFGFARKVAPWPWQAWLGGTIGFVECVRIASYLAGFLTVTAAFVPYYVLSDAVKPSE